MELSCTHTLCASKRMRRVSVLLPAISLTKTEPAACDLHSSYCKCWRRRVERK
ncbi:hypothetical protein SESBI_37832 [Sesbania bispinosa]|nr:hypothetical protein SESBI_37832 [Sesbania bispinosa]